MRGLLTGLLCLAVVACASATASAPTPLPTATATASAPGASATLAGPICTSGQLTIAVVDSSAAAGTDGGWLRFTNVGPPCSMQGWPRVLGVTASGAPVTAGQSEAELDFPAIDTPPLFTLGNGDAAYAAFAGSDTAPTSRACGPSFTTLSVTPPGAAEPLSVSAWLPYFDGYLPSCAGILVTFVIPAAARQ